MTPHRSITFYALLALSAMTIWSTAPGCAASHRYDDAAPLSFEELTYAAPVTTLEVDGVTVAWAEAGDPTADALVLVHGLGENAGYWDKNIAALAAHRRVIAIDLPGYGRSDKPEMEFSMAYYADVIEALLAHLNVKRAVLVGHSMGGQVALTYALTHPERLAALVLAAPAGIETFDRGEAEF